MSSVLQIPALPARMLDPGMTTLLRRGLVSYWPLDEASGTRRDVRDAGNVLTDNNTVTGVAGPSVNLPLASDFVAANTEYLSHVPHQSLSMGPGMRATFAGWVLINTASSTVQTFLSIWAAGGQRAYVVRTLSSRYSAAVTADGTTAVTVSADTFGVPPTATWHFLVVIYTGGILGISVNGGAFNTVAHTGDIIGTTVVTAFEIGRANSNGQYLNGSMCAWGLWDRALPNREIAALYNGGLGLSLAQVGGRT